MIRSLTYALLIFITSLLNGQIGKIRASSLMSVSTSGKNVCIKIHKRYQNYIIPLEWRCYDVLTHCVLTKESFLKYPQLEDCIEMPAGARGIYFIYIKAQFPVGLYYNEYFIVKRIIIEP